VNNLETKKENLKKPEKVILNVSKTDCTGCSTCADFKADNLRHAIARLSGVSNVKVNEITGKVARALNKTWYLEEVLLNC
jgi:hypothetical protein